MALVSITPESMSEKDEQGHLASSSLKPDLQKSTEEDMSFLPPDITEKDLEEAETDSYQNYIN